MIIRFQDALQTPPHEATRSRGSAFGDLRKQFYSGVWASPYEPPAAIHVLLQRWQELVSSKYCEAADPVDIGTDDGQVGVATHQCLEGLLTEAQAYVAEPLPFPSLMFTVTHRLRSSLALMLGHVYYPNAVTLHTDALNPGPLAAGNVARRYDLIATTSRYPWERSLYVQMIEAQSWHHQRKHEVGDPRL